MKPLYTFLLVCGLTLFGNVPAAHGQEGPEVGGHELEIWTGGGYGVKGVAQHTGVWLAGVRFGWILTDPHGPGFLRGRFEYAVDAIPAFVAFQPLNTAYGAAVNPFDLKWNFDSHSRVVPYADLTGGVLFTNLQVPAGTSRINFTPGAGIGLHFLTGKINWSAGLHYMHISNAGLEPLNPGINTLQLRLGIGWFTHPHE